MTEIQKKIEQLKKLAEDFATKFAEKNYLEEFKKSKLSILMKKYQVDGHSTISSQEREARADPEYQVFLKTLRTATEECENARYLLEIEKISCSLWQTKQATKRTEIKSFGG